MSYQRWTEGDAYVIGANGENDAPMFWCVACEVPWHHTYREIISHLQEHHQHSQLAIGRLQEEADAVGAEANWTAYLLAGGANRASLGSDTT